MSSAMERSTSDPSLPDEILLSCIARVSRSYYPILSLVSKSFRSLIASPELRKAQSLLGHTESCLYVCLKLSPSENPSWFTLVRKPDQTLTNNVTVSYALANVSIPQSPFTQCSDLVSVGSNTYNIVGFGSPSFNVWILDCRSHTWHEAPSLHVELRFPSASVVDGKIYVSGFRNVGLYTLDSTLEVFEFDTKTQIWDPLPSPSSEATFDNYFNNSICFDGKLREISDKGVVSYNFKEGRWEWDVVGPAPNHYLFLDEHCCEIENVWYCVLHGSLFMWYDTEEREWTDLKGMVGVLPKISPHACVRLVDCGGKMMLLWDEDLPSSNKKMIWCAEIVLEKNETFGICGQVEWFGTVLTVPRSYEFVKGLAATV